MKRIAALIVMLVLVCSLASGCLATLLADVEGSYAGEEQSLQEYSQQAVYDDDEPVYNESDDTWTIMLYLCGTDLESRGGMATNNLVEAISVNFTKSVNFLIQTGGTQDWRNNMVSEDALQRYIVENNNLTLLDEQPLASMGEPGTLSSFIKWGKQSYPADKYMLIFWNHGGGTTGGLEFDEMFNYDALTLTELGTALKDGGTTFEVIGFDTCLMATLENAATIAPYSRYMVASEELEPGGGWDYSVWPRYIVNNPNSTGLEVGKQICDSYYNKCAKSGDGAMATLSVIDLTKIPALTTAFDSMAAEMTGITADVSALRQFAQGAMRAESYGGNTQSEGYTNMVDLGDLAVNTQSVVSKTAENVLDALFASVQYQVNGASRSGANGISVFFPLGVDNEICDSYANVACSGNYLRFIDAINPKWSAPDWVDDIATAPEVVSVQEDDYKIDAESYIDEDGYYCVDVLEGLDAVQSVTFNLYYMDYEYGEYMLLGTDNDIDGDWDSGHFVDNFRGVWPTIEGQYCAPVLIAEEDDYNLYSIPILLNDQQTNLRAAYVWDSDDSGHFEIYGAWAGVDEDTGMSEKDIVKLKDGDQVTLLFDGVNWDSGDTTTYAMGSFTVKGDVTMVESELFDGEYLYEYVITDLFGNKTFSTPVIMEVKGEDINLYETE